MNTKKIIFTLILLFTILITTNVYAKEMVITCEYDKFLYTPGATASDDVYAKLKIVVYDDDTTAFYDNSNNTELTFSGAYINLFQGSKEFNVIQFYMDGGEKTSFVSGYKANKTCPNVTAGSNMGMIFHGSDLGYHPDLMYYPAEATKTTYPAGTTAPTDTVKLNKECIYSVASSTFSSVTGFDIVFQMYSNGVKKMCTRAKGGLMENCTPVKYDTDEAYAGTVSSTDPSNNRSYYISIKGKEIGKIYYQGNFRMVEDNTFTCPANDSLYFVETSFTEGMYFITTDSAEAADWGDTHTGTVNDGSLAENGESDNTNNRTITSNNSSVTSELDTSVTGCGIISDDLRTWLTNLLNVIRIGGLVLTLIFGMLDFTKATLSSDKDALKKAQSSFFKRLIAVVLLFIIPAVISFILGISGITIFSTDPFCGL